MVIDFAKRSDEILRAKFDRLLATVPPAVIMAALAKYPNDAKKKDGAPDD